MMVGGRIQASSPLWSRTWEFIQDGAVLARAVRDRAHRSSRVELADGRVWAVVNDEWGRLRVAEIRDSTASRTVATAARRSAGGRTWALECDHYAYELTADSMLGRRWTIGPPGWPLAHLRGGRVSYNKLHIEVDATVHLAAVILAWQIIVRAWEAAAGSVSPA